VSPPVSLTSTLNRRLLPLQAGLLAVFMVLLIGTLWRTGLVLHQRDEERVIDVVKGAIGRKVPEGLLLSPTPELQRLRSETPGLWFLVRDRNGHSVSEGPVPPEFASIGDGLGDIGQAKLGWDKSQDASGHLAARMKRVDTAAGNVQIIATTEGKLTEGTSVLQTALLFLALTLPSLLLMSLSTFVATPLVVRNALVGLREVADRATKIDINERGTRLPIAKVPTELIPLVEAINDALGRLDEGYDKHRRFLADAAHELRTPIAILTTRLETLPPGNEKARLLEDAARLATLAEQLLDLQRLKHHLTEFSMVDLVSTAARVTADLAPIAVSAGYEISFASATDRIETYGEQASLERAVVNLVQNAIRHGGNRGTITVSVMLPATIEVCDQGCGIPAEQRQDIFEPFHRLEPHKRGTGLGLTLVREIVRFHGGEVSVVSADGPGACFQIALPPVDAIGSSASRVGLSAPTGRNCSVTRPASQC
jgi:signal transduction histidine kinase